MRYTLIVSGLTTATVEVDASSLTEALAYYHAWMDPSSLTTPDRIDVDIDSFQVDSLIDVMEPTS